MEAVLLGYLQYHCHEMESGKVPMVGIAPHPDESACFVLMVDPMLMLR